MPKVNQTIRAKPNSYQSNNTSYQSKNGTGAIKDLKRANSNNSSPNGSAELLEVDPTVKKGADYTNIVTDKELHSQSTLNKPRLPDKPTERSVSEDFVDDPDVPPLI